MSIGVYPKQWINIDGIMIGCATSYNLNINMQNLARTSDQLSKWFHKKPSKIDIDILVMDEAIDGFINSMYNEPNTHTIVIGDMDSQQVYKFDDAYVESITRSIDANTTLTTTLSFASSDCTVIKPYVHKEMILESIKTALKSGQITLDDIRNIMNDVIIDKI